MLLIVFCVLQRSFSSSPSRRIVVAKSTPGLAQTSSTPLTQNRSPRTPARENSEFQRLSQTLNSTPGVQRNPAERSKVRKKLPVPTDPEPVIEPAPEFETEPAITDPDPNLSALTPMVADSPFFKVPLPPKAVKRPFRLKPRKMVGESLMLPKPPPIQREKRQRLMETYEDPDVIADKDELEELYEKARYLTNWVPKMKSKKMIVEGDLLHQGSLMKLGKNNLNQPQDRWFTSRVLERIRPNLVITKGGPYVLEGKMSFQIALQQNIPQFIMTAFKDGFPESWNNLRPEWRKFILQQRENLDTISSTASMSCLSEVSGFQPASRTKRKPSVIDSEESEDDLVINRPQSRKPFSELPASSDEENQPPNVMKVKVQVHRGFEKSNDISVGDKSLTEIIEKQAHKRKSNEFNQDPTIVKRKRGRPKKVKQNESGEFNQEPTDVKRKKERPKKAKSKESGEFKQEPTDVKRKKERPKKAKSKESGEFKQEPTVVKRKLGKSKKVESLHKKKVSAKNQSNGDFSGTENEDLIESKESGKLNQDSTVVKQKKGRSEKAESNGSGKVDQESTVDKQNLGRPKEDESKENGEFNQEATVVKPKQGRRKKAESRKSGEFNQEPNDTKRKRGRPKKGESLIKKKGSAKNQLNDKLSETKNEDLIESVESPEFSSKHKNRGKTVAESSLDVKSKLKAKSPKASKSSNEKKKSDKPEKHTKTGKSDKSKEANTKKRGRPKKAEASKTKDSDSVIDFKIKVKAKSNVRKVQNNSKETSESERKPEDDIKKAKKAQHDEETKKSKNDVKEKAKPKKGTEKPKKAKRPSYAAFKPKDVPKAKKAKVVVEKLKVSDLKSKPKNVKDLKKNEEILKAHNDNHEDDLFKSKKAPKTTGKAKSKTQRASDILDDLFKDSDSEQNISLLSAKTPILAFIDRSRSANPEEDLDEDCDTG